MNIEQLEADFIKARDLAYAASIEIDPREWDAIKAASAKIITRAASVAALDAEGREIGWAFHSAKYGLCCYRYADNYAELVEAMTKANAALTAAKKAAGHFRPEGGTLAAQQRRSRLGQSRPAGMPRAAWYGAN